MYHPPSKRKQIVQRVAIYGLMSAAVFGLVTILVFIMLGYQFNRSDGRIEQGGLVQFDSQPNNATVAIDGADFGTRTPSKTTMSAGQHFITMQRQGYKTWQKSIEVLPGSVLWLNYARFIPSELKTQNVADFTTISHTLPSPNARWVAIVEFAANPILHMANLSDDTVQLTQLELPVDSYTHPAEGKSQSFRPMSWDADSRFLLVTHTYDDNMQEWLLVDTQHIGATQNITRLLDISASNVLFSGNNSKILYAQIGNDIRRIDMGAATLSRPLVTNVAEFSLYNNDTIVFTTVLDAATAARSVGYLEPNAENAIILQTYTDDGTRLLKCALGSYFNDRYAAIAYGDTIDILTLGTSRSAKPTSIAKTTLAGGARYLSIVTEGRFVVAQNISGVYLTYDLELKKATTTILKGTSDVSSELHWLDGYSLWSDRDNMLRLYEFDGTNQHEIMPVVAGQGATLSPNGRYLYGISVSDDGAYHLTRVRMVL